MLDLHDVGFFSSRSSIPLLCRQPEMSYQAFTSPYDLWNLFLLMYNYVPVYKKAFQAI